MLTDAEQLEHLELTAHHAGLKVAEIVLPESHHIVIHRMRFHYLDWGTPGHPPILFLHGGGLNAHTWDVICLMLRPDYHCFALDQRGHGDSEWEPTSNYPGFYRQTAAQEDAGGGAFDGRLCRAWLSEGFQSSVPVIRKVRKRKRRSPISTPPLHNTRELYELY